MKRFEPIIALVAKFLVPNEGCLDFFRDFRLDMVCHDALHALRNSIKATAAVVALHVSFVWTVRMRLLERHGALQRPPNSVDNCVGVK